jgi:hypothetical protein
MTDAAVLLQIVPSLRVLLLYAELALYLVFLLVIIQMYSEPEESIDDLFAVIILIAIVRWLRGEATAEPAMLAPEAMAL